MNNVQFNLLPELKMTHVKASRTRALVVSTAVLVSGVTIGLFLLLFLSVNVVQKKQIGDADKDIAKYTAELKAVPNIDKILTIQNQLKSLTGLHQAKHITSRIFTYLPQVTPANVKISRISLDFATSTIAIDGTADTQVSVNTFVDTLKFTEYKVGEQGATGKAFSTVTESSFSINPGNVSYGLTVTFDPTLFANNLLDSEGRSQTPVLVVPKLTTTHATSNDPGNSLFNNEGGQ